MTGELQVADSENNKIRQLQLANFSNFPWTAFLSIGFTHHCIIITKVKDVEERKFYIQLCADLSLSVDALERKIAEDAYHNQGKMPNNFGMTIPDYKRAFQAIQMFKDEYLRKPTIVSFPSRSLSLIAANTPIFHFRSLSLSKRP